MIANIVITECPNASEALVNLKIREAQMALQGILGISDDILFDENTYNTKQQHLVAMYAAYLIECKQFISSQPNVKKKKMDVMETEYFESNASFDKKIEVYKTNLCQLAKSMNLILPICEDEASASADIYFKIR